ncbi:hypothetical protein TrispH2_012033 [Trichoplax sp. H2]|nr:hypothetical protein TrispH2_012033 [Trichoplax sp. H2]|eukprot:RDD35985.1 hypothetical protein TrispH2_012033 [Trichoplax sp. H2]
MEVSNVGSTFANKLVARLRQNLSEHSVQFFSGVSLSIRIGREYKTNDLGRLCSNASQAQIQLKSKDRNYQLEHEIYLYFEATSSKYQNVCPSSLRKKSPAIDVECNTYRDFSNLLSISDWTKKITTSGPADLLLAYAAANRQYPDETSEINIQYKKV